MNIFLWTILAFVSNSFSSQPSSSRILYSETKWNLPKIVWTYFDSGLENADLLNNKCYRHNLKILNNTGWELRFLTDATLSLYINVTEVNEFMQAGYKLQVQAKSDLIRMLLLSDYGGLWMDSSTYLLQNLEWLENIHENPFLQTKFDRSPEVFAFTDSYLDLERLNYPRKWIQDGQIINPNIESWFLAAVPHSNFFKDWTKAFKEISSMNSETMSSELGEKGYELSSKQTNAYFKVYASKTMVFTDKQKQLNKEFEEGKLGSKRTAMEEYRFWTMESSIGPYLYNAIIKFEMFLQFNILLRYQQKDVYTYRVPRYLIKISGGLNKFMMPQIRQKQEKDIMYLMSFLPTSGKYKCLNHFYMIKNSIFYNMLTENGQNQLENQIKYYEYDEIPFICHHFTYLDAIAVILIISFSGLVFTCALINRKNCKTHGKIFNQIPKEITQDKVQSLAQHSQGINLSWYFVDFSIAAIVLGINIICLFSSLIFLKYLDIFVYIQFLINFLVALFFYKLLSIILANIDSINLKELWKKRFIILLCVACENVLYQQLKQYYYQPNTSINPEIMISCVTITKYFIQLAFYTTIYFLFMQEIIIERNLFKYLKKKCFK